jgi:FKBP-type peptidyl-prolyl cis-trans isomerase
MISIPGYKTVYTVLKNGDDKNPKFVKNGSKVTAHGKCIVIENNNCVWSTFEKEPFTYIHEVHRVINSWYNGCMNMKIGEYRRIISPPEEGCGYNGFPLWKIPPNVSIIFEVEIIEIE